MKDVLYSYLNHPGELECPCMLEGGVVGEERKLDMDAICRQLNNEWWVLIIAQQDDFSFLRHNGLMKHQVLTWGTGISTN